MKIKNSRGFSLLEIIIGMLILSLVVTGITGLFVSSHRFIIQAGHRLAAINYARQVAETLKVYVSADANTPTGAGTALAEGIDKLPSLIGLLNELPTVDGITMTCNYDIDENVTVGGNATTLESATITVTYPTE